MSDSTPSPASSGSSSGALVAVGRILGPHGRDGEVRVKATSDVPGRFDVGESLSVSRDGVIAEGRTWVVDLDLEKFFDGVHPERNACGMALGY